MNWSPERQSLDKQEYMFKDILKIMSGEKNNVCIPFHNIVKLPITR